MYLITARSQPIGGQRVDRARQIGFDVVGNAYGSNLLIYNVFHKPYRRHRGNRVYVKAIEGTCNI
jgi:hypothetical protein